jgi:hypothetical protein
MSYSLKGDLNKQARVIVIDQDSGTLEDSYVFNTGEWELLTNDNSYKIVLAIDFLSGEAYGYSNVTPTGYVILLATDSEDNVLAINSNGDALVVGY